MLSSRRLQCRPFRCSGHGSSGVILLLTGRDRPTGVLALTKRVRARDLSPNGLENQTVAPSHHTRKCWAKSW